MFSERLREVRDVFFAGNNVKFAEGIHAKEASVRSWLTGKSVPGGTFLAKICDVTAVSPDWLLRGKGPVQGDPPAPPDLKVVGRATAQMRQTMQLLRAVPILADEAAAGDPRSVSDEDIEDYAVIYDHWHGKEQRALRIKGESMSPTLEDGDIVGIDVSGTPRAKKLHGRVVAARVDGGVVVKRLSLAGDYVVLMSDNKQHPPLVIDSDADAIIGPVIWAWHKF